MATSGTYWTEVPLKGSAEKHYNKWRKENHTFPDAIGHLVQSIDLHEGEWDSHGSVKIWNYTIDGKQEVFKEKREFHDETKTVTAKGIEGHIMERLKVFEVDFNYVQKSEDDCVCKITMRWEKLKDEFDEPSDQIRFVKKMVAGMEDHVLKT